MRRCADDKLQLKEQPQKNVQLANLPERDPQPLSMPCAWAALACNASMEVPSFPAARMDWATWLPGQVKFLADEL